MDAPATTPDIATPPTTAPRAGDAHGEGPRHRDADELARALDDVRAAPADAGRVEMLVRRPATDAREVLDEVVLDVAVGVVGDTWDQRPSSRSDDGGPHPDMQLNLMGWRAVRAIADEPEHRALAGDQVYVDLDLTEANLPAGTRLSLGSAVIEVTDQPHTGCAKFSRRFGPDALRWVNSPEGRELRLRGINAKVVTGGAVAVGDVVTKLSVP